MGVIGRAMGLPRTTLLVLLFLLLAGGYAYVVIPKEQSPDVKIPVIYAVLSQEGISPEDSERLLVRLTEEKLQGIEGLKEMRSKAYQGGGSVVLEFDAGFDSDSAYTDVLEEVDGVRSELPSDADEPKVREVLLSEEPVLVVGISSLLSERVTANLVEELADRIEALPEVLQARVRGKRDEVVEFEIFPETMEYYGLDVRDVVQLFGASNRVAAGGRVEIGTGEFSLSMPGLFEDIDDIMEMPLVVKGDSLVRVRDVAQVKRTFKDAEVLARYNSRPGMAIEVVKRSGENLIEASKKVKFLVSEFEKQAPEGLTFLFSNDQSIFIERMLNELQNSVILSVFLVMVVVVGALGLRGGILVSISIPGAFLAGILILYTLGLTVNMVVLFALILSIGLLVDGAIVMTEYADREMRNGVSVSLAYRFAAERMSWPIIASTLTTLAAFIPLMFWPGIVGEFMQYLPLTLIAVLSSSLLMALLFMPVLGANLVMVLRIVLSLLLVAIGFMATRSGMVMLGLGEVVGNGLGFVVSLVLLFLLWKKIAIFASLLDRGRLVKEGSGHALPDLDNLSWFTGLYVSFLRKCTRTKFRSGVTVFASLMMLVSGWVLYGIYGRGVEFFPDSNPDQITVSVSTPGNLTLAAKDRLVSEVENRILELGVETGEFVSVYTSSGDVGGNSGDDRADLVGKIFLELSDWELRRDGFTLKEVIRERVGSLRGALVEVSHQKGGPPQGKALKIQVKGNDREALEDIARRVIGVMSSHEAVTSMQDDLSLPGIEWKLNVDRAEASKYGFDVGTISSFVRLVTSGTKLSTYRPDDSKNELDVRVRFPEEYRTLSQLDSLRLAKASGETVPISHFVTREVKRPTGTIRRVDGERVLTVQAEVLEGYNVDAVTKELKAEIDEFELPQGVGIFYLGQNQDQDEASAFLMKAFAVALFLICVVLVTQFNSFYKTVIILSAVVMSTTGVVIGLLLLGQPFGIIMSGIGVISLAGIVVNNNIVLIDTYNHIRKEVEDVELAILYTGAQRLRPVLLTTVTTVLGLLPMALQFNVDFFSQHVEIGAPSSEFWRQLANAIVCGLAFATLLTLFMTPSLLRLGDIFEKGRGELQGDDVDGGEKKGEVLSSGIA